MKEASILRARTAKKFESVNVPGEAREHARMKSKAKKDLITHQRSSTSMASLRAPCHKT